MSQNGVISNPLETLKSRTSTIKVVPLADIRIDLRFQRALATGTVNKILAGYHPKGIGQVLVAEVDPEEEGEALLACLDGQTRIFSLRTIAEEIQRGERAPDGFIPEVTAEVFEKLTVEEAAALFRLRNQQQPVSPRERARISLTEGDPLMHEVIRQAEGAGYKVFDPDNPIGENFDLPAKALNDAMMVVRWDTHHEGLLTRALTIQKNAFPTPDGTLLGTIEPKLLSSTAWLLHKNPHIDEDELTRVMSISGLTTIMSTAEQKMTADGMRRITGYVRGDLVTRYNKNRRRADQIQR